eukprot:s3378_g5.t1
MPVTVPQWSQMADSAAAMSPSSRTPSTVASPEAKTLLGHEADQGAVVRAKSQRLAQVLGIGSEEVLTLITQQKEMLEILHEELKEMRSRKAMPQRETLIPLSDDGVKYDWTIETFEKCLKDRKNRLTSSSCKDFPPSEHGWNTRGVDAAHPRRSWPHAQARIFGERRCVAGLHVLRRHGSAMPFTGPFWTKPSVIGLGGCKSTGECSAGCPTGSPLLGLPQDLASSGQWLNDLGSDDTDDTYDTSYGLPHATSHDARDAHDAGHDATRADDAGAHATHQIFLLSLFGISTEAMRQGLPRGHSIPATQVLFFFSTSKVKNCHISTKRCDLFSVVQLDLVRLSHTASHRGKLLEAEAR